MTTRRLANCFVPSSKLTFCMAETFCAQGRLKSSELLWRCGDGLVFEVPPLASDALLTTLHPLLENVLNCFRLKNNVYWTLDIWRLHKMYRAYSISLLHVVSFSFLSSSSSLF
jgi:hypothetical protein